MSPRKVLFVANISRHILRFHLPYLKWFQDHGFETHLAAGGEDKVPYCDVKYSVPISRSPFSLKNVYANQVLKKIVSSNNFSVIHCHTPMGGVLARIAARKSRGRGTKVLYTAHGFHFFKGAPVYNWIFYYPIEKYLSKFTDGIITINMEDYQLLFNRQFSSSGKYYINGMGVDEWRFKPVSFAEKCQLRHELGYSDDRFILIYVAEFISRKNHNFIIESTPALQRKIPNLKILFAGRGRLLDKMKDKVAQMELSNTIEFLGFRTDVEQLMAIADVGISASKQEGLGLNLAEEMLTGLPIVATWDRGHRELVSDGINGFLFEQRNTDEFVDRIITLSQNKELRESFGQKSIELAQKFTLKNAVLAMEKIYNQYTK